MLLTYQPQKALESELITELPKGDQLPSFVDMARLLLETATILIDLDRKIMIAIRKIQDVKSGPVIIDLPPHFHARRVEIIILPFEEVPAKEPTLLDLLLEAPTLTDDESQEYEKVREWMNETLKAKNQVI